MTINTTVQAPRFGSRDRVSNMNIKKGDQAVVISWNVKQPESPHVDVREVVDIQPHRGLWSKANVWPFLSEHVMPNYGRDGLNVPNESKQVNIPSEFVDVLTLKDSQGRTDSVFYGQALLEIGAAKYHRDVLINSKKRVAESTDVLVSNPDEPSVQQVILSVPEFLNKVVSGEFQIKPRSGQI